MSCPSHDHAERIYPTPADDSLKNLRSNCQPTLSFPIGCTVIAIIRLKYKATGFRHVQNQTRVRVHPYGINMKSWRQLLSIAVAENEFPCHKNKIFEVTLLLLYCNPSALGCT